jgi:hypothetical protein
MIEFIKSEMLTRGEASFQGRNIHRYGYKALHRQAPFGAPFPKVNRFQVSIAGLAHIEAVPAFTARKVDLSHT